MTITLTQDQHAWIQDRIAAGEFASEQDAVRALLDAQISARLIEDDDLIWAKSLVDEGVAAADRGELIDKNTFNAHLEALAARLRV